MKKKVKRVECGWAGHFCCARDCLFRRNTHLEYNGIKVVVSTVGNLVMNGKPETVGLDRQYETMAFFSDPDSNYDDLDASREIHIKSKWYITPKEADLSGNNDDWIANKMHENCVKEIEKELIKGVIK